MPAVLDLSQLTLPSAFQLAVRLSGLSHDEIATAMGWAPDKATRIFNPGDSYWPALASVPALCRVLGNTVLARWIVEASGVPVGGCGTGDGHMPMVRVASVMERAGAVCREAGASLEDGVIEPVEARRVLRTSMALAKDLTALVADMQRVLDEGGACSGRESSR